MHASLFSASILSALVRRRSVTTALALIGSMVLSTVPARAQVAGLVAAYGFNETSGTAAADVSAFNNTGTFGAGVTRTAAGKFGGGLVFNGSTGRVTIPNAASLGLTTAMTLEAWVNPSLVDASWRDVVYKGNDNYYLMGTTTTSSRPAGGGTFGGGPGTTKTLGTTALAVNTWTHLAVTYDGATLRLYVNGVQVSSVARTGAISTSTNPLTIGGDPIYGQGFQGTIDEVRVYNRALSVTEVQTDMNTAIGVSGPDTTAPTVSITSPTSGPTFATNATSVTLSGSAADNVGVTQVTWTNSAGGSGTATGTSSWSAAGIALQPGTNVLTVTAQDAAGNTGTAVLTVTSDPVVPTVAITSPTGAATFSTTTSPIALGGTANDNVGVTQVTWANNRGGSGTAAGTTSWTVSSVALQTGDNVLTVTARDAVGNIATSTLTVTYTPPDVTAPTVSITSPTSAATYTTNASSVTLSGSAADNVAVTQVTWTNSAGGSGTATGTTSWSATSIALQPGTNVITVTARDAANNPATATLTVTQDATLPTVAITAPAASATVSGTITPTASASDNIGVIGVQFLLDGAPLGAEVLGSGPYVVGWNTTAVANGLHTLTARARDAAGNIAVSSDVSVTVSNTQVAGLVAAYGFNEASGTTTTDASSSNNTGTFGTGVTRTASGKFGGGLVFNGTTGRVTIPNAASLALTTAMTLEAWVNPSVVNSAWRDVVYKGNDNYYLMGTTTTSSRPAGGGIFGGGSSTTAAFGTTALVVNTWTHLAVTYDGAALRLYVNGVQVSSVARTGAISTSTNPLTIGGDPIYGQGFQGTIDEVRVYNRALSLAEVQTDMNTAVGTGPSDTVAPTVAITSPTSAATYATNVNSVTLSGSAADNVGVTQVTWTNSAGGSGTATGTTSWSAANIVLQPGTNVLNVTARDAAANVAVATLTVTYTPPDVVSPTIGITSPTSAATYATNATSLTLSGSAADNVGVTQVTWTNSAGGSGTATGTTSWSVAAIALQVGTNVLTVTARDAAGNVGTAVLTVSSDPVVPTVAITSPTSGATFATSTTPFDLGGTAADNVGVTQVTWANNRGGSGTAAGTTSWTVSGVALQTGDNVLTVTARDAVGNVATSTLTVTYTVADNTAPTVGITSPTSAATYATNATSLTLSGSAADNVGVTQVTWTNSAGGSGTATGTTSWSAAGIALQSGTNVLTVTARDAAGNVGTAVLTVTSDPVVPTVAITSPTSAATFATTTSPLDFGGTSADNVGVTQVTWANNRGGSGTAVGTTSWTVSGVALQIGDNVLTVTARDAVGNVATSTLTVTYTAPDVVAPTINITSPTSAATFSTNATTLTVAGTAADNVGVTQVTWTNSAGGSGTATGTTSWSASGIALQPGTNVITVTARDAANNPATATLTITQDAIVPTVAITSPTSGATFATSTTPFDLGGTSADNVGVTQVTWANNRGGSGTATGTTSWTVTGVALQTGDNVVTVTARDAVGNVATSTLTVTYTVADNTAPTIAITAPTSAATFSTNATTLTVAGTAADNVGVTQVTWTNSAGGSGTATGTTSWSASGIALQPGTNVITVTARDAANNPATATLTITQDAIVPTVAITSPTGGATFATSTTPLDLGGTSADNVGVTQVTWANNRGGSGTATGTTSWTVTGVVLQTGDNVVTVTARDAVGNVATSTLTVTYTVADNTAPTIAITAPTSAPTFTTNQSTLTVAGTAADNVAVTQVTWTNSAGGSGTATGTTSWSASGIALQPGTNVITVTARDAANNPATATLTVTQDATVPTVAITAPGVGTTVSGSVTVTASASDNIGVLGVQFLLDGTALGAEVTGAGPYSTTWNTAGVTNGSHTLTASAHDAAGNTTLSAGVAVTVSNVTAVGLVAAYSFDETSGTTTTDASSSNNTGTFGTGVTRTTSGKFGGALTFNGSSGMVTIPNAASLDLATAVTLEAWVNPSIVNSGWRDVIYKGNDNYYLMGTTSNNSLPAGGGTFGSGTIESFGTAALPVNTWTHLAMSYNGATIRVYVNGTQVSTLAQTGAIVTSTNPLTIGGDPIYGQNFQGMIDEVRVYNRALSVAEIQTDMVTAIGGGPPPDVTAPTIAITTPTGTGTYTAPSSPLTIGGTAADNVGVTQVTWVSDRGGSGSATGTTAWSVSGIVLQPGTNVVTVTARDAANNATTATLTVTYNVADTSPPVVAITAPTTSATYATKTSPVTLSGSASDNVGVTQVTWTNSAGGSGTATGTTSWTASGIVLQAGTNVLTVTASDAASNVASATLTVTLDVIAPTVALTAPAAGTTVSGATTTITASAADNNALAGVQMLLDGAALGVEVLGAGPTYTFLWNTAGTPNGPHTLSARARDAAGNTALAADVAITVSNAQPAGLVAAYGFEEVSGTSVNDASGNNNTGNLAAGVTRTPKGRLGAGLQFNGGLVNILNSPSLGLTTAMTMEAWVNPAYIAFEWRDVVYKANDNFYLMATTTNASRPAAGGKFNGASTTTQVDGTSALPANAWSHLAMTYDGAALRLYVNGTQVSSVARTGPIATSSNPLTIGGDSLYGQYFAGTLDEVRIYNRALSPSEIATDMSTPVTDPAPPPPPAIVGEWGTPFNWPIVGIHSSLLKTGEVLTWEYDGAGGPYLWNPLSGAFTAVPQPGNKFCAGQAALPDGRLLIAGGHEGAHVGLPDMNIFDPVTRGWSKAPDMTTARWYPTVTALADGRSMITSGETNCDGCLVDIPEIYNPVTNLITRLTSASAVFPYYPHMYLLPDGRIFAAGTSEAPIVSKVLDIATQTWSVVDPTAVDGGSSVMYLPGKIMKTGTSHNPDLVPDPSSAAAYVIDMTQPSPHWLSTAPMANPRTYHTLTVLPDGNVLATGGGVSSDAIGVGGAVYAAELWSPSTQTWTTLSSGSVPRLYHSTALLLPDGRLLITGGGRFNGFPSNDPTDYLNAETFSPPYLFKGARPAITSAPDAGAYGSNITVQTPDAASISSVSLVRLGAVTHAINMDQRYVPLSFTANDGSLDVQMPANSNLAPPGYYMLFILNGNGVPSIASMIRMQ